MTASAALAGRTCLITGGAGGIGWAMARLFALQGAQVHVADISEPALQRAEASLEGSALASRLHYHQVDVSDRSSYEECITGIHERAGRLDVLVNNAAFVRWRDVEQMTVEEAERSMRTGYDAMVYGVRAALPLMRAAGRGHIVNMGSATGIIYTRGPSAAYAASKAAIEAYTQILRLELKGAPVRVTLVRPSTVIGTDFFGRHVASSRMPRIADFLPRSTPEQVAQAVLRGVLQQRDVVDFPGYMPLLYRSYALAPELFRKLTALGGPARTDFSEGRHDVAPTRSGVRR
ncbi:SDR family NAD(P)-dependent oxidoreductase [Streptomyces sp. NPDC058412]|uniref:SDR family NAD(P)-dependent oxidoreductase n=1 Tax=Streptomyces sp. NPDC058412 TaxID=3346486 RepID=UPI003667FBF9